MARKRTCDRDIDPEDEFLARYCRIVLECAQTPELIRQVAGDADFVLICRRLAAPDADVWFTAFCNRYQFNARRIRQRLKPVTRALRLDPQAAQETEDFYALLGVDADADGPAIKHAFRRKALELHPDKRPGDDGNDFMALQAAYVHLSDPELRRRHDRRAQAGETWVETGPPPPPLRRRRVGRPGWLIGGLTALLVAAAFGVEFYVEESSFSRGGAAQQDVPGAGPAGAAAPAATAPSLATECPVAGPGDEAPGPQDSREERVTARPAEIRGGPPAGQTTQRRWYAQDGATMADDSGPDGTAPDPGGDGGRPGGRGQNEPGAAAGPGDRSR